MSQTQIATDLYCVVGHPVAHSRSPWIHARFAELTGQQLRYSKLDLQPGHFADGVRAFMANGGRGCNVTVPFKFEAATLADAVSERAALAQACNTLTFANGRILADNTDGIGLVHDITQNAGISLHGKRVLLIGAGGAAAGVLAPLIEAGAAHICVANRTAQRATALVTRHQALAILHNTELIALDLQGLEANFDVIINATATSLGGHAVPVTARVLKPGALAYDMMYGPAAHGFLDWARAHGAHGRDGLGMLVSQAAESFCIWRGVMPPAAQVLAQLRAVLEQP